ncbi:MAG: hypothetical protein K6G90_00260 [Clostridia bacterium]|nr:hypothetical protein [Clostridia bacterium]
MKRLTSLCLALFLALCFSSCSESSLSPEPQSTKNALSGDAQSTSAAKAAEFRLQELPDIGSYRNKAPACFYDEPLKEFRESDDYGLIVPYCVTSNGKVKSCGFMTADGRLITDAIYSYIEVVRGKDDFIYAAGLKNLVLGGEDLNKAYDRRVTEMISKDGGKRVSLADGASPSAYDTDVLIQCRVPAADGGFVNDTFLVYDFDLEFVADLSGYGITYGWIDEGDRNSFTVCNDSQILYFENGELIKTEPEESDGSIGVFDGMILKQDGVYDKNGEVIDSFASPWPDYEYDESSKSLFVAGDSGSIVTKLQNERITAVYGSEYGSIVSMYSSEVNDEFCLVLLVGYGWGEITDILVLDTDMNLLNRISGERLVYVSNSWGDSEFACAASVYPGRTEIYDLSGDLRATMPFEIEDNAYTRNGYAVFYDPEGKLYLYGGADGSLSEYDYPAPDRERGYYSFINENVLTGYSYSYAEDDPYHDFPDSTRYWLIDRITGETKHRTATDMIVAETDEETYISIAENGMTYVYDGRMNLITAFLNQYYA